MILFYKNSNLWGAASSCPPVVQVTVSLHPPWSSCDSHRAGDEHHGSVLGSMEISLCRGLAEQYPHTNPSCDLLFLAARAEETNHYTQQEWGKTSGNRKNCKRGVAWSWETVCTPTTPFKNVHFCLRTSISISFHLPKLLYFSSEGLWSCCSCQPNSSCKNKADLDKRMQNISSPCTHYVLHPLKAFICHRNSLAQPSILGNVWIYFHGVSIYFLVNPASLSVAGLKKWQNKTEPSSKSCSKTRVM